MPFPQISGFEASEMLSNDDVRTLLDRVPEAHRACIATVRYVDEVRLYDPADAGPAPLQVLGDMEMGLPEHSGAAAVSIYRQQEEGNVDYEEFTSALYHEVGHAVHQLVMDEERRREWNRLAMAADFYFNEAGADPVEHFAECYAQFVVHPRLCESATPAEFAFIRDTLFDGMARGDWL